MLTERHRVEGCNMQQLYEQTLYMRKIEFKCVLAESNSKVSLLFLLHILQNLSGICVLAYCANSKSGWETNLTLCSKVCFACEKLTI